jgi:hypothetical protein
LPARRFVSIVTVAKSARSAQKRQRSWTSRPAADGKFDIATYMENAKQPRERSKAATESRDLRHMNGV